MVKRTLDLVLSLIGLIVISPLFIIISFVVVSTSKGGVFFRGLRVGKNGKPFKIFKFRSMIQEAEGNGNWNVGSNDPRVTKIGLFLRKTKLDELPQLINVVKGEMSFVGPRPELQYYVDMYTEEEKRILYQRPGVTDWASLVNISQYVGFSASEDPDAYYLSTIRPVKLKLQQYYCDHSSIIQDFRILIWTVYKVITRSEKLPKEIIEIVKSA